MTMDDPPFSRPTLNPVEEAVEQNTREGLRALFHWAVFPFPLALIPLAWLSRIPFVGMVAGLAGLVVLIVWAMRARAAWGDKLGPLIAGAWDAVFRAALSGYQNVSRGTQSESRRADEYRVEGDTAVRAALMDTVEADIQVAGQVAAWRTQIDRLSELNTSTSLTHDQRRDNELVIRQLRRNIADVEKAEAERTGVALETHGPRPLYDALLPAEAAPARRLGFLPMAPGFTFPFSWALAAVLAVVGVVQTVRVERVKDDARDVRDALEQVATERDALRTQANMDRAAFDALQHENVVTRELAESVRARQERTEARLRRSQNDQLEAARGGRPVDLDGRLRDFTVQPFAGTGDHSGPAGDPAGGVPDAPAGALDLSTPDALPTGHDWPGAGDSNVPG